MLCVPKDILRTENKYSDLLPCNIFIFYILDNFNVCPVDDSQVNFNEFRDNYINASYIDVSKFF